MRRARPEELNEDAKLIALLQLSEDRLRELFSIELSEADPLSAAEPSIGGLVQLDSGPYAVVVYGKITGETEVSLPVSAPLAKHWTAFLREVPLVAQEIVWTSDWIKASGDERRRVSLIAGVQEFPRQKTQKPYFTESRPPSSQHSGEDARVPAVETTALLCIAARRSSGGSPAAIEASRLGG
ncbi:MAG: hypothetical protein QOC81_950 [Thermoanaerobaculia bacterium]|nr:hypothetical protein [Thermoanaerobaculia bacterium]